MYSPKHFQENTAKGIWLAKNFPFATLISTEKDNSPVPLISHVPLLCQREAATDYLVGHFAQANPHSQIAKSGGAVTVVFHGPHEYISPTWYRSGRDVPTWNYAVAHAHGYFEAVNTEHELLEIISDLSRNFEKDRANPWRFSLPDDLAKPGQVSRAILGFKIKKLQWEVKLKLSQNRSLADREGIIAGLEEAPHFPEISLLDLQRELLSPKP